MGGIEEGKKGKSKIEGEKEEGSRAEIRRGGEEGNFKV